MSIVTLYVNHSIHISLLYANNSLDFKISFFLKNARRMVWTNVVAEVNHIVQKRYRNK